MIKRTFLIVCIVFAALPAFSQSKKADGLTPYNNIRFAPLTALDVGVGFTLSYERLLGKDEKIGVVFPFSLILEDKGTYNNESYNPYFYFLPGLKVYPFGQRRVTYALGPNLIFGYSSGKEWRSIEGNFPSPQPVLQLYEKKVTKIGVLVNNYVSFQITRNFNLGLEAGLGMCYLDQERYVSNAIETTINNGFNVTGQFSMTLGYRF